MTRTFIFIDCRSGIPGNPARIGGASAVPSDWTGDDVAERYGLAAHIRVEESVPTVDGVAHRIVRPERL